MVLICFSKLIGVWESYFLNKMGVTLESVLPLNSLAPGRFEQNFRYVIFKLISVTDGWGISCEIVFRWMPLDLTNDKSALVQVMAWCRQATSHYWSQCWPRFMLPCGASRPQWVNSLALGKFNCNLKSVIRYHEHFLLNYLQKNATRPHWWLISQHWFRQWYGAVRHQAITWVSVDPDLCCHIASLGHSELISKPQLWHNCQGQNPWSSMKYNGCLHWSLNKMTNILQTIFSNAFS